MITVLYFSTEWCGPCKLFYPTVQEVTSAMGIPMQKVDAEKNRELAQEHNIHGVPSLVVLRDGTPVYRNTGVLAKSELLKTFERLWKP